MYPNVPGTEGVQGVQQPLGCTHVPRTLYPSLGKEDNKRGVIEGKIALTESNGRGTTGGTTANVPLDEQPDFGTSDEGYWNSLLTEGN